MGYAWGLQKLTWRGMGKESDGAGETEKLGTWVLVTAAFSRKERRAVATVHWSRLGKERAARRVLSMVLLLAFAEGREQERWQGSFKRRHGSKVTSVANGLVTGNGWDVA